MQRQPVHRVTQPLRDQGAFGSRTQPPDPPARGGAPERQAGFGNEKHTVPDDQAGRIEQAVENDFKRRVGHGHFSRCRVRLYVT